MITSLVVLFLSTIVAFWISAICGGGASLILIPLLNFMLPSSFIPFSLTIGTFTSSVSRIVVFKRNINWKIFLWFVPFSIPAVLLGGYLIKYIEPSYLQLIVAFFLIGNIPQLFKSKKADLPVQNKCSKSFLAIIGFLSGFVSGITGAIGLLFNRFYLQMGLSKEEIIATRAANEVFLHFVKLIIYIALGFYSRTALGLGLAIALTTIVSSVTVKFILPYVSDQLFKKIGYGAMVVSGIVLLASSSRKIVDQNGLQIAVEHLENNTELALSWRETNFILEYSKAHGLEFERSIHWTGLPLQLQQKYFALSKNHGNIYIEKVMRFRREASYEFYSHKEGILARLD
ncbi:sulfite exporter TauE/SafE family protein [Sphingobacterium sp.]|uniref:sulfite exporter TauE/SafE family protein n=1 Tax=Sphingobacterium sp. TaxID=341027 RepID=UPI00289BC559|nr:sulfite exporter TauE/SafE family protein [Sphingobacterium sp.]